MIERARLPLAPSKIVEYKQELAIECALAGGDDYELLFAAPAGAEAEVARRAAAAGTPVTRIGRFAEGPPEVAVRGADGAPLALAREGWSHF